MNTFISLLQKLTWWRSYFYNKQVVRNRTGFLDNKPEFEKKTILKTIVSPKLKISLPRFLFKVSGYKSWQENYKMKCDKDGPCFRYRDCIIYFLLFRILILTRNHIMELPTNNKQQQTNVFRTALILGKFHKKLIHLSFFEIKTVWNILSTNLNQTFSIINCFNHFFLRLSVFILKILHLYEDIHLVIIKSL